MVGPSALWAGRRRNSARTWREGRVGEEAGLGCVQSSLSDMSVNLILHCLALHVYRGSELIGNVANRGGAVYVGPGCTLNVNNTVCTCTTTRRSLTWVVLSTSALAHL